MNDVELIVIIALFSILGIFLIMLPFIFMSLRKVYVYDFNGHKVKVHNYVWSACLWVDDKMVDKGVHIGHGGINLILLHKQENLDIFVRITTVFQATVICKINNEVVNPTAILSPSQNKD